MQTSRTAIHKTRRGKVSKQTTEHYLRDDIFCGLHGCEECEEQDSEMITLPVTLPEHCSKENSPYSLLSSYISKASTESMSDTTTVDPTSKFLSRFQHLTQTRSNTKDGDIPLVIIPERKIFNYQLDLLECNVSAFSNIIVLQHLLNDISTKHYKTYQRIRALSNLAKFKAATGLKSNFQSSTQSVASDANKQVVPHVYVFSNIFHQEIYTQSELLDTTSSASYTEQYMKAIERSQLDKQAAIAAYMSEHDHKVNNDDDDEYDEYNEEDIDYNCLPSLTTIIDPSAKPGTSSATDANTTTTADDDEDDEIDTLTMVSAKWLQSHYNGKACVVLLTNNVADANKYADMGVQAMDISTYVSIFESQYPNLTRVLAKTISDQKLIDKSKWVYDAHYSTKDITMKLAAGTVYKGVFEVNRDYWAEAYVTTSAHGRVLIPNFQYMNRAVHGDTVVVELLDASKWQVPSTDIAPPADEDEIRLDGVVESAAEAILQDTALETARVDEVYIPELQRPSVNVSVSSSSSSSTTDEHKVDETGAAKSGMKLRAIPTGKVVGIIERKNTTLCGSIQVTDKTDGMVLFNPVNRCYPKVLIESKQLDGIVDQRVMVSIDEWPVSSKHPLGHLVKILGDIGNIAAETQVLLIEHDIKHDKWSAAVEACLPGPDYEINEEECTGRVDLRHVPVCSIDPPGCVDIDDALHCVELDDGTLEVGVHIADVTHYVKPGSALDQEAAARSTSVYLVDRRIDMIPARLSTNLCSLHENVDRLAFSVVWKLDKDANILDTKFFKSIIRSRKAFAYAEAQSRINTGEPKDELTTSCINLMNLARKIKNRRNDNGALTLASSEVKFKLGGTFEDRERDVLEVGMYQTTEAHSLVEEFMLLANVSVAEHILAHFPSMALLRRHPTPSAEMLQTLVKAGKAWNYDVDISNGRTLNDSLDKMVNPKDKSDKVFNKVVRMLTTRCMTRAKYVSSGETNEKAIAHFGLACQAYTHFTSPIRRYSDIIAHRLLATSIGIAPLPDMIKDKAHMRDVVENLNLRHHMAQLASRASTEVWTLAYFTGKRVETSGRILAVRTTGIRVLIPDFGIECAIRLVPREYTSEVFTVPDGERYEMYQDTHRFIYDPNMVTLHVSSLPFKVLDEVDVRICVKENASRRRWLSVELIGDKGEQLLHLVPELRVLMNDGNIVETVNKTDKQLVEESIVVQAESTSVPPPEKKKRKTK